MDEKTVDASIRVDTVPLLQVHNIRNPLNLTFEALRKAIQSLLENEAKENLDTDDNNDTQSQSPEVDKNQAKYFIKVRS